MNHASNISTSPSDDIKGLDLFLGHESVKVPTVLTSPLIHGLSARALSHMLRWGESWLCTFHWELYNESNFG